MVISAVPTAAQDDVPLIADMDIEALLEQELNTLNVDDFYLLDHLIDINSKVKEQQGRMDAVRDEATRIFESFGEIETQILLDRQQSETVLDKAFEQVVRTYVAPTEPEIEEVGPIVDPPKDVLLGAATRGDLDGVELIAPASIPQSFDSWSTDERDFEGPSILVLLLEEMERNQADQASLRETLRDEILALGAQLENIEESEVELERAIRALRAELVAINAREIEWDAESITPETIILPSSAPITSGWGRRWHPILRKMRMHYGSDFDGARGSPVWAAHQGVVETATYMKDFGRVVVLNHGNGFSTLYAHLNKIRVKYGETVRQGQRIGDIGSSGLSTGPHLHFEIRVDHVLRNPKKYLPY
ncbi:MAG: peptidoglycan DD-metalloendopeptidase family protein [Acidimicrobiales bacterium]|nr:peptidoglycan DD-metalloendopeptidase family protein [Acidimicrobiales bacterium]